MILQATIRAEFSWFCSYENKLKLAYFAAKKWAELSWFTSWEISWFYSHKHELKREDFSVTKRAEFSWFLGNKRSYIPLIFQPWKWAEIRGFSWQQNEYKKRAEFSWFCSHENELKSADFAAWKMSWKKILQTRKWI